MDSDEIDEYEAPRISYEEVSFLELQSKILKFLFNAVNVLPSGTNLPALRSYFLNRGDGLFEVSLPKSVFRARCKFCFQPFGNGAFAMKVSPKKPPGKRMRRILRKASVENSKLSRIEKKLLLNAQNNPGNKLVLKCSTCQKATVKPMVKPPLSQRYVMKEVPEMIPKKRKKKKKNKYAGLKIPADISMGADRKKAKILDSTLSSSGKKKKRGLNVDQKKHLIGSWGCGKQKKKIEKRKEKLRAKLSHLQSKSQGSSMTDLFRNLGRKLV